MGPSDKDSYQILPELGWDTGTAPHGPMGDTAHTGAAVPNLPSVPPGVLASSASICRVGRAAPAGDRSFWDRSVLREQNHCL